MALSTVVIEQRLARDIHVSREDAVRECVSHATSIAAQLGPGHRFHDPDFDMHHALNLPHPRYGSTECKRLTEIFQDPVYVSAGTDLSLDVKQGGLGNCWLIAAMAALGQRPDFILDICVYQSPKQGIYGFVFYYNAQWKYEIIDDNFRVFTNVCQSHQKPGNLALCYARCVISNNTWAPLLEKAYAKCRGSYRALIGGHSRDVFKCFTTSSFLAADRLRIRKLPEIAHELRDMLWTTFLNAKTEAGLGMVCVATIDKMDEDFFERTGLSDNHVYAVLNVAEYHPPARPTSTIRLMLLRDARNRTSTKYKGPWEPKRISKSAAASLGFHRHVKNESFPIAFDDFVCTFSDLDGIEMPSQQRFETQARSHVDLTRNLHPASCLLAHRLLRLSLARPTDVLFDISHRIGDSPASDIWELLEMKVFATDYTPAPLDSIVYDRKISLPAGHHNVQMIVAYMLERRSSGSRQITEFRVQAGLCVELGKDANARSLALKGQDTWMSGTDQPGSEIGFDDEAEDHLVGKNGTIITPSAQRRAEVRLADRQFLKGRVSNIGHYIGIELGSRDHRAHIRVQVFSGDPDMKLDA